MTKNRIEVRLEKGNDNFDFSYLIVSDMTLQKELFRTRVTGSNEVEFFRGKISKEYEGYPIFWFI